MKALTGPGFQSFSGILPFSWDKNIAPPSGTKRRRSARQNNGAIWWQIPQFAIQYSVFPGGALFWAT